jgi:drug/metabolite transporter (DMT)-like permease
MEFNVVQTEVIQKRHAHGIQAALVSAVFLGLTPVFGRLAIHSGFSPLAVVAFRTFLAAMLLVGVMAVIRKNAFTIYPIGLAGCLLAGVVNGVGSILFYSALGRIDATLGQVLYSTYPVFVALWMVADRQSVNRLTVLRLGLSIPAVLLLVNADSGSVDLPGVLMMIGAAVLYSLHLVINQRVLYDVPTPTVTMYTLLAMSVVTMIAYLGFDRSLPASGTPWWPILGLAGITFFARLTLFMGVKRVGGLHTALLGLAELLVTIFTAYFWLDERLSLLQWLGASLMVTSLLLVGREKINPLRHHSAGWLGWLRPPDIPRDIGW